VAGGALVSDLPNIPPAGRKRGRPADPILKGLREMFPLWSDRTIARYKAAMERMRLGGATTDDIGWLLDHCKRKSGTLRVNLLERYTRKVLDEWTREARP
jgi:hypothetical protein